MLQIRITIVDPSIFTNLDNLNAMVEKDSTVSDWMWVLGVAPFLHDDRLFLRVFSTGGTELLAFFQEEESNLGVRYEFREVPLEVKKELIRRIVP